MKKMKPIATIFAASAVAIGMTACDVDQTAELEMPNIDVEGDAGKLPDIDVTVAEEGRLPSVDVDAQGGQLPKFDVDVAEVDVTTKTKTIEVPVPEIDIKMPKDDGPAGKE